MIKKKRCSSDGKKESHSKRTGGREGSEQLCRIKIFFERARVAHIILSLSFWAETSYEEQKRVLILSSRGVREMRERNDLRSFPDLCAYDYFLPTLPFRWKPLDVSRQMCTVEEKKCVVLASGVTL